MRDTDIALKFRGKWNGKWAISDYDGDFILVVSAVDGCMLQGEAYWYGTASLTPNEPLEKAFVADGALTAEHPSGVKIRLEIIDDDTISGSWKFSRYKGTLEATRVPDTAAQK